MFKGVCLLALSGLLLVSSNCEAGFVANGSFETGNFSGWTTIGDATIQTSAFGSGPTSGTFDALITTGGGTVPAGSIGSFLGLPVGNLNSISTGTPTEGSAIRQLITGVAGDILTFNWNFLTNEATPTGFNDFSFWSLVNISNGSVLANTFFPTFVNSPTVFNEETGFQTTSVTLTSSGSFLLGFGVVDVNDSAVSSGLLIDNVSITTPGGGSVPEPSSMALLFAGVCTGGSWFLRRRRQGAVA